MKRFVFAVAMALLIMTTTSKAKSETDTQYHILTNLWQTYYKAEKADKPKDQLAALKTIKAEARNRGLAWDFYHAAQLTAQVTTNINWKDRTKAQDTFVNEVEEFGEPAAVFYLRSSNTGSAELLEYARANRSRLEQTNNVAFHNQDGTLNSRLYSPALRKTIANDWDYALWHCYIAGGRNDGTILLDGSLGGAKLRYPWNAFVDYDATNAVARKFEEDAPDKSKALWEDYRSRNAGKAAELMGWQELIRVKMRSSKQEADFKALLDECKSFEKSRSSFMKKDVEYEIANACDYAEALIETLNRKSLSLDIENGKILVQFVNLPSCNLKITKEKQTVWQSDVKDPLCRFFVPDSVWIDLPVLDDGDYDVVCTNGKIQDSRSYGSHTLSIATRCDSRGRSIYVADYKTGEPLDKCDLTLFDNDDKVIAEVKDFSMNGFTPLPETIASKLTKYSWDNKLVASSGSSPRRLSKDLGISRYSPDFNVDEGGYGCTIITDRTAFNPGETVHFKAIAWSGKYDMKAVPQGTALTAVIFDPDGNELSRKGLKTNEFGAAEGEFELVRTEKGGRRELRIEMNGTCLASDYIRVDDFVLPTFTLDWEKDARIYVPGDTVEFRGRIAAYSGHSISSATARYEVSRYSETVCSGTVQVDRSGEFVLRFPTEKDWSGYYYAEVTVSDATGETLEFRNGVSVSDYLDLNVSLANAAKARLSIPEVNDWRTGIISGDEAVFKVEVREDDATAPGLKIRWTFSRGDEVLQSGELGGSGDVTVPVDGLPSGLYKFKAEARLKGADGQDFTSESERFVIKMSVDDTALCDDVTAVIRDVEDDPLALQLGATGGRAWFVVEVFGNGNVLLESRIVTLAGEKGKDGSLETVRLTRGENWPEDLRIRVFMFRNGEDITWERDIEHDATAETAIPLSFTRFLDTTLPGTQYTFEIASVPGIECAATVYDKSVETVSGCRWYPVHHPQKPVPSVYYESYCGSVGASWGRLMVKGGSVRMKMANAAVMDAVEADCVAVGYAIGEEIVEEEAIPFMLPEEKPVEVRENFANTIAWEPFLRSDADGRIKFEFRTADKLSTYVVQLFAHDKDLNTGVLRREMVITLPVKIAVLQPEYLYEGDCYVVHATLSNSSEAAVAGKVVAQFYDGGSYKDAEPVHTCSREASVPVGGSAECAFEAPAYLNSGTLGMLLRFIPDDGAGADAVFVTVPFMKAAQTVTEAHSALLKDGESRIDLEARLRSLFVNVPGADAKDTLISIRQMLQEAVPQSVQPKSDNILALLDAVYSNIMARNLGAPGASDAELANMEKKIAGCRNSDGGYAWFEGMSSSPIVTAAALERLHRMAAEGYVVPAEMQTSAAAMYLDKAYFSDKVRPFWCGGIGMEQYLYVRALYPVAFTQPDISSKSWLAYKKAVKDYLVPSGSRGLEGQILPKARRLATLRALLASKAGTELAAGWGIALPARMSRSVTADVESLLQYSVDHWAGGCYYPNAVMPWRGLLESELYAHNLLARLLEAYGHQEVADGIRLWMMIQKESQQWESDPAYVEALGCVFDGSESLLRTSVLALSATCTKPLPSIVASGNDMTASRHWLVQRSSGAAGEPVSAMPDAAANADSKVSFVELKDGDVLQVGDRVRAEYRIWNRENRSFVKLSAPRPAAMRPVEQLSGHIGWWLRPLRVSGWYDVCPQGYRSVLTDRTEYWFDSYPEENTTVSEEFFVTQEGVFQTPVVTIESLYAPHYRANSSSESPRVVR